MASGSGSSRHHACKARRRCGRGQRSAPPAAGQRPSWGCTAVSPSTVDGICMLPPWAAMSRASMTVCAQGLESQLALLLGVDADVRLLGHAVVLGLTVGGPAELFSCCEWRGFSVLCFVSPGLTPPGPVCAVPFWSSTPPVHQGRLNPRAVLPWPPAGLLSLQTWRAPFLCRP